MGRSVKGSNRGLLASLPITRYVGFSLEAVSHGIKPWSPSAFAYYVGRSVKGSNRGLLASLTIARYVGVSVGWSVKGSNRVSHE